MWIMYETGVLFMQLTVISVPMHVQFTRDKRFKDTVADQQPLGSRAPGGPQILNK